MLENTDQLNLTHLNVDRLRMERDAALRTLDRFQCGIVLVDSRCKPFAINRRAEELLELGDGIALRPDGLSAATPAMTSALRQIVFHAVGAHPASEGNGGMAIMLPRPSGSRALAVVISAIQLPPAILGTGTPEHAAAIYIYDPDAPGRLDPMFLQQLHGLTPTEAKLTKMLCEGNSIEASARVLGIRISTARSHLKRIFMKTGVSRQAELVQIILTGMGQLRTDLADLA